MQSLNFYKDKLSFTGTYQEFIHALHVLNFWEREEDNEPQKSVELEQSR